MPHTRFVLKKALEFGHAVVVVVNKIDSSSAHPEFSVYSTFELFIELNATDEQVCLGYNLISLFSVFYKLGSYLELEVWQ
jgi:predicted membrane GTPase involved in stress response